jgi:hypothetical protein
MIDEGKMIQLRGEAMFELPMSGLSDLTVAELLAMREEINSLLPDTATMDLHKELASQFAIVKQYQADVMLNDKVPPNQIAQCMNTTVATLGQLIKMQESLERAEAFKKMETCLIEAVLLLPEEAKLKFYAEYEALALDKGLL